MTKFCEHLNSFGTCEFVHNIVQRREELRIAHVPGVTIFVDSIPQEIIPTGAKFTQGQWRDIWVCQLGQEQKPLENCTKWMKKINRGSGTGSTSHSC